MPRTLLYYEKKLKALGFDTVIGVDEAGRGPLAGPVVAAAVLLRTASFKSRIDDSKRLTPSQREMAYAEITRKADFGIGIADEKTIDLINIGRATRVAMEQAVEFLVRQFPPEERALRRMHVIVDGNVPLAIDIPCTPIVRGDSKSVTIACASILAKVTRDRIMSLYDAVYPQYGFLKHKGYPTKGHREALKRFGPSGIHRQSFSCV